VNSPPVSTFVSSGAIWKVRRDCWRRASGARPRRIMARKSGSAPHVAATRTNDSRERPLWDGGIIGRRGVDAHCSGAGSAYRLHLAQAVRERIRRVG
jgi:hypothetical protein